MTLKVFLSIFNSSKAGYKNLNMSERHSNASFNRLENESSHINGSVPSFQDFESSTMQGNTRTLDILNEMKQLHEERLRRIEQEAGRDSAELKVKALESWVMDLEEQNTMLVQILGKLEQETVDRVSLLKEKLQTSAVAASKFMESEQDRERLNKELKEENEQLQNTVAQLFIKLQEMQSHITSQCEQQLGKMNQITQKPQNISENYLDESIESIRSCFDEVLQERQQLLQEVETLKSELSSKNAEIEKITNKVLEMDEMEEKKKPEVISCCKGTENAVYIPVENHASSKLSVKEIYNYRHSVKTQEETVRKWEGDLKNSQSAFNNQRLHTEETEMQLVDFHLKGNSRNFESSSASEEDASITRIPSKLKSAQNQVKALKDKARSYVQNIKMAEQNQADSERRIRELKSILDMSQCQVGTVLERASEMDVAVPYVQEAQKYNEGSQEAFKNMGAEINFLLFNLRSRMQQCSDFEETVSSMELSLEELQDSLLDIQNIMNANAAHAQLAPNQGPFERADKQAEELQKELNRSKEDEMRYRHQIHQLEAEISNLRLKVTEIDILQETLFRMKSELQTVTCSLDAKEQIVKDQEEMISILQDSVNIAEKEQAEIQNRLTTLENEKEKTLNELEEVEKRAQNLQEALLATKKQLEELQGSKFEVSVSSGHSWGWPHPNRNVTRHTVHDV